MSECGLLIVLSGPSGAEGGTVRKVVFDGEENDFQHSTSMTTRKQQEGEVSGIDYYFRSREESEAMIEVGGMSEYMECVGNYYGAPLTYANQTPDEGKNVFLGIEVQRTKQVKSRVPDGVFILLTPPDLTELKSRIIGHGADEVSVVEERIAVARGEIEIVALYDYAVVNDEVPLAMQRVKDIIASEHFRVDHIIGKYIKTLEEMQPYDVKTVS